MNIERTLSALPVGAQGRVTGVKARPSMARRLLDLGLTPGTWVTCVGRSPAGDPGAYRGRGAVIALRDEDASGIRVTAEEGRPVAALAGWD